jgi:nucleotide-binding universal stress UspA family protein
MPRTCGRPTIAPPDIEENTLSTGIIVSYDGTPNDDDALALGRLFARTGATIALAYVRHSREFDPGREVMAQHDAEQRLEQGAAWLGQPDIPKHVVIAASTGGGLAELAQSEGSELVVFGSDYRTPPGRVEPGPSARYLLEGGPVAVAIAPAGLRARTDEKFGTVAVSAEDGDPAATETAETLAAAFGTTMAASPTDSDVGLIVAGSSPSAPEGRVLLSGASRYVLETARAALLVVPRGRLLRFGS